ncbi:MAG: homocitrate synthase [Chloroflexota bacterium]
MQQLRIIDTTLREGEQFAGAHFTSAQKRRIARALDAFGVEYIEVTSPAVSSRALADARAIAGLGLRARVLAHVRCHPDDIDAAIGAGVHGINLFFGTSAFLRQAGHGRSLGEILEAARASVARVQAAGMEVRFSCEDSFRSSLDDLLPILRAVDAMGVQRIGVADTVGIATPRQVYALVSLLRNELRAEIEFHGHNDSGCAVANAHAAIEAGAGYIDTTVLGIGERNGIASLEGLVARVSASEPALLAAYDLRQLIPLAELVSTITGVAIPFNHSIAGSHAFSHRAGVHLGAVLKDPRSYEAIDPALFGAQRQLDLANPLTGRHAVRHRATELGVVLTAAQLAGATRAFKERAARRRSSMADLDEAIRSAGALAL